MIKILISKWECEMCGSIINSEREIVIDEYTKEIEIVKPNKCHCGSSNKSKLRFLDLEIKNLK